MHGSTDRAPPTSNGRCNWRRDVGAATQRAEGFRRDRGAVVIDRLGSAEELRLAAGALITGFMQGVRSLLVGDLGWSYAQQGGSRYRCGTFKNYVCIYKKGATANRDCPPNEWWALVDSNH